MKKILKNFLISIFLVYTVLSLSACENQEPTTINLTSENIFDYINIDFCFGDMNVQTKEEKLSILSSNTETYYYVNCVCDIKFSPKANYNFKDLNMSISIKSTDWDVKGEKISPSGDSFLSIANRKIFSLDKEGYGTCTVLFSQRTEDISSLHPLQNKDWEYTITNISGTVSNH